MRFLRRYLLPRLAQYILVTFLGLTLIFFLPRLMPINPIQSALAQYQSAGMYIPPEQLEKMIKTLKQLYGLEGTLWQQYLSFWSRLFRGDFGPSLAQYPASVIDLIRKHLPWTIGLLVPSTFISWLLGTIIGGLAGYNYKARWTRILDNIFMFIRPVPYYIMAFLLLLLLAYVIPVFPLGGGAGITLKASFDLKSILNILRHAFLPALSLIILGIAEHFQAMKLTVQTVRSEDYVTYAQAAGVQRRKIAFKYVIRNAMLPRITHLGMTFGYLFSGALITEMVFAYPGVGWLLYNSITRADYNLFMGVSSISLIVITTSILVIDLIYPLVDPRIRYK